MTEPTGPPPGWVKVRDELERLLATWAAVEPGDVSAEVRARAAGILHATKCITDEPPVAPLEGGIERGDPIAFAALVPLRALLERAAEFLIHESNAMREAGQWRLMLGPAGLATEVASAAGLPLHRGMATMLFAQACRGAGDTAGAIRAYRHLIDGAAEVDGPLLARAHGNLANALADLGEFDEAREHFGRAIDLEEDPAGIRRIRANRARAWTALGMLRAAAAEYRAVIGELEAADAPPAELAMALDAGAQALRDLGEHREALEMLDRARALFDEDEFEGRAVNALIRASVHAAARDRPGSGAAFAEAHDLALERARSRLDPDGTGHGLLRYRRGFEAARAHRSAPGSKANRLFAQGMKARDEGGRDEAIGLWHEAAERASRDGDLALVLQIDAHRAALELETGDVESAADTARQVRQAALQHGLAKAELHAVSTLATLADGGMDIAGPLGALGLLAEGWALNELHERIVGEAGSRHDGLGRRVPAGALSANLAVQAERYGADELVVDYYRSSLDVARSTPRSFQLANRLGGLCRALGRLGEIEEAARIAVELEGLLEDGATGLGPERRGDRTSLTAHRALGFHLLETAGPDRRGEAVAHFQQVTDLIERQRGWLEAGSDRVEVTRLGEEAYRTLAWLHREAGDDEASFEALQGAKGRHLLDLLAEGSEGAVSDAPADTGEARQLVARLGADRSTTLVDLLVEEGSVTAYLADESGVRAIRAEGDTGELDALEQGDVDEREGRLVRFCLESPLLSGLASDVTAATPEDGRLLLVPDGLFGNLPLHIVPVDGLPWGDRRSISYHLAVGALRFAPQRRPPNGRSLVAGDSANDLRFARSECEAVARSLGTQAILGQDCTFENLAAVINDQELDVVHLAVHGRGDARRGQRSSLLLASPEGPRWVPFDDLLDLAWRAELVVFSGCSTGVSGRRHGVALAGVSRAAAQAGAAAVLACLWPVYDAAGFAFMQTFYAELARRRASGPVDLRDLMDLGRAEARAWSERELTGTQQRRDGRRAVEIVSSPGAEPWSPEVTQGIGWGPFTLLGDPILGG